MAKLSFVKGTQAVPKPSTGYHDSLRPLEHLLRLSVALLGADRGTLWLCDQKGNVEIGFVCRGYSEEIKRFVEVEPSCPVSLRVLESHEQVIVESLWTDERFQHLAAFYVSHGVAAIQAKPLINGTGKLIGVLSTSFGQSHRPSGSELRLLDLCAEEALRGLSIEQRERESRMVIDELKELNTRFEKLNATLTRSNQDLKRFAVMASHDLKEPLRTINAYSELLWETSKQALDDEATGYLRTTIQAARQMNELLGSLMACAQVGALGQSEEAAPVDLNVIVQTVVQNLKGFVDETRASITSEPLPVVFAHRFHLVQLFQNLIENGLKYRSKLAPKIHISSRLIRGEYEVSVTDNGVGIDPRHHDRIFEDFQRLHTVESPGTGLGLSICERVVQHYGGQIWVESQVGDGATFRFTLPNLDGKATTPIGLGTS